ncbi:hypothetical protein [Mycoplasma yeatsii]|uniref:hypothetical protein n=1 Tax=Mycoplasma yeatsii TaxID=51365 RepID=UPI0005B25118|nr:hypothetical protein [Mycoplasma yeatsii]AJM72177.1 membrane protein [Mycoplasma yeatsii GM274B]
MSTKLTKKNVASFLKRQKYFRNFINENDLLYTDFKKFFAKRSSNSLVKNYLYILGISNMKIDTKQHWDVFNFINLCAYYLYYNFTKNKSKNKLEDMHKTIILNTEKLEFNDLNINYEQQALEILSKEFKIKFTEKQIKKYFSYHEIYCYIANAFSKFFYDDKKQNLYDYIYWLTFYILVSKYFFKKNHIQSKLFMLQLISNQKFTEAIAKFSPELFNLLIIKNNRFSKTRKKHNKGTEQWKNR